MRSGMEGMAETELRSLVLLNGEVDRALGDADPYDIARKLLDGEPEISDVTRNYLVMRGLADFIQEETDHTIEL
jgi:hypothetical protein